MRVFPRIVWIDSDKINVNNVFTQRVIQIYPVINKLLLPNVLGFHIVILCHCLGPFTSVL